MIRLDCHLLKLLLTNRDLCTNTMYFIAYSFETSNSFPLPKFKVPIYTKKCRSNLKDKYLKYYASINFSIIPFEYYRNIIL